MESVDNPRNKQVARKKAPVWEREIVCEDTGETVATYAEYLKTDHWRNLRERYKKSKLWKGTCSVCWNGTWGKKARSALKSKNMAIQFHHVTYERIGHERLSDIVPLCAGHHSTVHTLDKTTNLTKRTAVKRIRRHALREAREKNRQESIARSERRKRKA